MLFFYLIVCALTAPQILHDQVVTSQHPYTLTLSSNTLYIYTQKDGYGSTQVSIQYQQGNTIANITVSVPSKFASYYRKYSFENCKLTGIVYVQNLVPDGVVDGVVIGLIHIDQDLKVQYLKSQSQNYYTTNQVFGGWPVGYISHVNTPIEESYMYGNQLLYNGRYDIRPKRVSFDSSKDSSNTPRCQFVSRQATYDSYRFMDIADTIYLYGTMKGEYQQATIEVQYYDPNTDSSNWVAIDTSLLREFDLAAWSFSMGGCQPTGAVRVSGLQNSKVGMGFILRDTSRRILIGRIRNFEKFDALGDWVNWQKNSLTGSINLANFESSVKSSAYVSNGYYTMKNTASYWSSSSRHNESCTLRQNGQCISSPSCAILNEHGQCSSCNPNFVLNEGNCQCSASGYYGQQGECKICKVGCKECASLNYCGSCRFGFDQSSGNCECDGELVDNKMCWSSDSKALNLQFISQVRIKRYEHTQFRLYFRVAQGLQFTMNQVQNDALQIFFILIDQQLNLQIQSAKIYRGDKLQLVCILPNARLLQENAVQNASIQIKQVEEQSSPQQSE